MTSFSENLALVNISLVVRLRAFEKKIKIAVQGIKTFVSDSRSYWRNCFANEVYKILLVKDFNTLCLVKK